MTPLNTIVLSAFVSSITLLVLVKASLWAAEREFKKQRKKP